MSYIKENLLKVKDEINSATLIAVSKYSSEEDIRTAYTAGQRHFAEAKLQVLEEKSKNLDDLTEIIWHFIGPLQSNKIKKILQITGLQYIHSVHNLKTLRIILNENKNNIKFFLQVNSSLEVEKQGFVNLKEVLEATNLIKDYDQLGSFQGLMTMAKLRTDDWQKCAAECFKSCQLLAVDLESNHGFNHLDLSMGMSRDYKIALEFGASWVRVGSSIFNKS